MALPRLNESPQYELIIPSTKQTVKYRPFLVKEQKVLLIAYESQDQRQIINAILNCISGCVSDNIDVSKLSTFDTEYIFTQIRSKSVGEKTTVIAKCGVCETPNDVTINLENVKLKEETAEEIISITESISVKMRYPTYYDFTTNEKIMAGEISTESLFEMVTLCIESVMTEEENIVIKDEPREEIERFINSLSTEQFSKIREFIENIPKIHITIEFNCNECNELNKHTLEGLQDFFS